MRIITRYHEREGLFFERWSDGSVRVVKTDGKSPDDGGNILFEQRVPENTWASAVCAVSSAGENADRWQHIRHFHAAADGFPEIRALLAHQLKLLSGDTLNTEEYNGKMRLVEAVQFAMGAMGIAPQPASWQSFKRPLESFEKAFFGEPPIWELPEQQPPRVVEEPL